MIRTIGFQNINNGKKNLCQNVFVSIISYFTNKIINFVSLRDFRCK